jgi:hypothetical protein
LRVAPAAWRKEVAKMPYGFAKLSDEQLAKVKELEKKTGKKVLVYRTYDVQAEDLTPEELTQVKELEKELGYMAIVVK